MKPEKKFKRIEGEGGSCNGCYFKSKINGTCKLTANVELFKQFVNTLGACFSTNEETGNAYVYVKKF